MQSVTVNNHGKGYTYIHMGLGWKVSDDGLLQHGGGGPGIAAMLYAHPAREFAAAILTNADHSVKVINGLMGPWLESLGTMRPFGESTIVPPTPLPKIDPDNYVGVYEDLGARYRVMRTETGLALSRQWKFAFYDNTSTSETAPTRLIPLGDEQFLLEPSPATRGFPDAYRIYVFRNPDAARRMRHLGNAQRLYKRAS
jgi:hypothetical protein